MRGLTNFIGLSLLVIIGVVAGIVVMRLDDSTIYLIAGILIGGVCFAAGGVGIGVLAANYFGWGTHRTPRLRNDPQPDYQAPMQIRRPDEIGYAQLPAPRRQFYMIGADGSQANTSGDIEVEVE